MGRARDPLKQWKLSPMDVESLARWDAYTKAKEAMLFYTDTADAPWTIVRSDDKKRARLNAIRHVLYTIPYDGKDKHVVQPARPADPRFSQGDLRARREAAQGHYAGGEEVVATDRPQLPAGTVAERRRRAGT